MEQIKSICMLIIIISLISVFYLSYNYIKFMDTADIYSVGEWAKETIGVLILLLIFFVIISMTMAMLLRYKKKVAYEDRSKYYF